MLDLEEKVLHHSASEVHALVTQQAANNKVAVPAVHFIEAATGYDVLVWKIKQSGRLNLIEVRRCPAVGHRPKSGYAHRALLLHPLYVVRLTKASGEVENGRS